MEVIKIKSLISKECRAAKFDDTKPSGGGCMVDASLLVRLVFDKKDAKFSTRRLSMVLSGGAGK
ncbi:MAG: hypothetical protein LBO79_05600 [Zoogloeaceae bacterium]|jgi:hypothetical protein|nr:hypothetical protein [Zoogloeaceae bacterium]